MKNNFITKIIGATLAFAMMIGGAVGINAAKQAKPVHATTNTISYEVSTSATIFGATISSVNGTSTGTVQLTDGADASYDLVGVCKLEALKSGKSDHRSMNGGYAQIGSSNARVRLVLTAANIPDTISSIDVDAYGSAHTMTVKVGGTSYYSETLGSSAPSNPVNIQPNASGALEITFAATTYKALYFKSLSVTYGDAAAANTHPVTFDTDGGSAVLTQNVTDSEYAERPSNPTKRGFSFDGWYDNPQRSGETYDFENTPVTDSVTLYAKWNKVAETASYSLELSDGDYRLKGEVTAITGSSEFFIQSGNNVMHVGGGAFTSTVHLGNNVDLFGTYSASGTTIGNLAYCDKDTEDTNIEQSYISDLANVTDANLCKYFRIEGIRLNSGFDSNKKAVIRGSDLILFYNAISCVNGGEFNYNDYSANDFVRVQGVVYKQNTTLGLYITHIEKMTSYVVTFNSNEGTPIDSQIILAGGQVERPADPTRASDENYTYTFAGWYDNVELDGAEYDFDSAVNSSFTLYAKWNRTDLPASQAISYISTRSTLTYHYSNVTSTPTDSLNREFTGIEEDETNYDTWSGKNGTSGAVYAGNSAGLHNSIQLRSNNNNSGVVTTASGGEAKVVTVAWNSQTQSGRKLDIYGKSTSYSAATDLYSANTQGTKLGTIEYGKDTSLTITGTYAYIGFRSASGAMYLDSVEIEWEKTTYTYSNVGIRYGGLISTALWNRLNTESTIEGYGVVFSTITNWTDDQLSDYIGEADNTSVWNFYTPLTLKAHPDYANSNQKGDTEEEYYVWSLFKNISAENTNNFKVSYTGVAYIKTTAGYVFFEQTVSSVKSLAAGLLATSDYNELSLEGSLYNLANL